MICRKTPTSFFHINVTVLICFNLIFIVLQILVEFDNQDWKRREWVRVHDIFQIFLVEHTVIWAEREDPEEPKETVFWPALVSVMIYM